MVTAPAEHRSPLTWPWRWAVVAAALVAFLAVPQLAKADSLFDAGANCIHTAPASWVSPPSKSGDQFVVEAPAKYMKEADDAAHEIRSQDFFGYYEDKLKIARLGYPGQQGKFELFLDPALTSALPEGDGVNARRCEDSARDAVIVDTGINSADDFHATIAHELFHAAQAQLGGHFADNWWYEATATWAETRFGYNDPNAFSTTVTDHPHLPIDQFGKAVDGTKAHEYGAWTFVAWLFSRDKIGWGKMRDSFIKSAHADATPIINNLVKTATTDLGDEIASFWADHTNNKPQFGPTAHISVGKAGPGTQEKTITLAPPLGAQVRSERPAASEEQMELIVPKVPPGVEVWIRLGEGKFWRLDPGSDFDETFCRSGATAGSLPLPANGEVRLAITTTSAAAPSTLKLKTITVSKPCPKQFLIQPGKAIGPLHLGMNGHSANQAVPKHHKTSGPIPTPLGEYKTVEYILDKRAGVLAGFLDGRIAYLLIISNNRFVTTDGITTFSGLDSSPFLLPGSALADFKHDHCLHGSDDRLCWREGPKSRFTAAEGALLCTQKPAPAWCPLPNDYYIGLLAVATHDGLKVLKRAFEAVASTKAPSNDPLPTDGPPAWVAGLRAR